MIAQSETPSAKLTLTLIADSGYECEQECRISTKQWEQIQRVINGTERQLSAPGAGLAYSDIRKIFADETGFDIDSQGCDLFGFAKAIERAALRATQAAPQGELPKGLQPLPTVEYWVHEYAQEPYKNGGGMIVKLLREYLQVRKAMLSAAPSTPAARGWAIKGPEEQIRRAYPVETAQEAWLLWDDFTDAAQWIKQGYTCVPVTITEDGR